jgi:hypothetical protein
VVSTNPAWVKVACPQCGVVVIVPGMYYFDYERGSFEHSKIWVECSNGHKLAVYMQAANPKCITIEVL